MSNMIFLFLSVAPFAAQVKAGTGLACTMCLFLHSMSHYLNQMVPAVANGSMLQRGSGCSHICS